MRILVLSDLYPPHFIGGYELICKDVADELKRRGHSVRVLTSTFGVQRPTVEGNIYRLLDFRPDDVGFGRRVIPKLSVSEFKNNRTLKLQIRDFKPDVVSVWHPTYLLRTLLITLNRMSIPVVYNILDNWLLWWYYDPSPGPWLVFWRGKPQNRLKRALKATLKAILATKMVVDFEDLDLSHICFISSSLKEEHLEAGLQVKHGEVIRCGIPMENYPKIERPFDPANPKLLYIGRVTEDKGVHTAIEAMSHLREFPNVSLTIVGGGDDPQYVERLRRMVLDKGLEGRVVFTGVVPPAKVVEFYHSHDIFLFPSIWREPLGRTWMEAMACGLPVIGTTTGGSGEVFVDGENCLTFPAGDGLALAERIRKLIRDRELYTKLSRNGADLIRREFTLEKMVDGVERCLKEAWRKGC
jgi:glycosyltransferase involved in cell wall biosynthesis